MRQREQTTVPDTSAAVARSRMSRGAGPAAAPPARGRFPARLSAAELLAMQRSAGNRAVGRMLGRPEPSLARCAGPACACGGRCGGDREVLEEQQPARPAPDLRVLQRLRDRHLARATHDAPGGRTPARCGAEGGGAAGAQELSDEIGAQRARRLSASPTGGRAPPVATRLARCAGAGCHCGGRCHDQIEDELPDRVGPPRPGRAVLARRRGRDMPRTSQAANPATGRLLQRRSHCDPPPDGTYKQGEGMARGQGAPSLSPTVANVVGGEAWELYNFDIDKSFVKSQHEEFIRDTVVRELKKRIEDDGAYAMVVGEASTTASLRHNLKLSKERAACVIEVLKRELRAAGVKDVERVLRPWWTGELLSLVRRLRDEYEHEEDRLVTIIPVDRDPDQDEEECPEPVRTRASSRFRVKYACGGPGTVKINIGDVSVKDKPTYRKFRWITSPAQTCRFRASTSGQAQWRARRKFSLALHDPDQDWAPSDLVGEASLQAGSGWLFAADGKFSVKLAGKWPAGCKSTAGEVSGQLVPDGPVRCGEVPQPERDRSCDEQAQPCTDDEKMAPAKKFAAYMVRFAGTLPLAKLLKKLPKWAVELIEHYAIVPQGGVALVTVGTREGPQPRRMRRFLFAGIGIDGDGLGANVGFDSEAEAFAPMRLAEEDPGDWKSASDFDHIVWAKLEVKRGTNVEELSVGDITFRFHGANCNGSSSTLRGVFRGVSSVDCEDIGYLPEPPAYDCGKDDCPADTQLAEHDEFLFKIGRASVQELPAVGRTIADRLGCQVVAARINIGSLDADPIYREFLFIGRRKGCRFDVDRGVLDQKYTFDRRLSIDDPDAMLDPSDFAGLAKLSADGELTVRPLSVSTEYSIKLPGGFDATCTGLREVEGGLVPLDDVKCGEVPAPRHDTAADDTGLELCGALGTADAHTTSEIERFRAGEYDDIVDHARHLRALRKEAATIEYADSLDTLTEGQVLRPAVFIGINFQGLPIVTIVDMLVVTKVQDAQGNVWVSVRFLSDPCSYDKDGTAVFAFPYRCKELLPYKGLFTPLDSVTSPRRRKQDPDPPEPDDGLKTAVLPVPAAAALG